VAGLVIYLIAVAVAGPINRVVDGLKDAAEGEGDLTKRLAITSSDEIGMLDKWFNLFVERVQAIIRDVQVIQGNWRTPQALCPRFQWN